MADNNTLYLDLELRSNIEDRIRRSITAVNSLEESVEKLNKEFDKSKDPGATLKTYSKNINDAEKQITKILEVVEKANKAMGKNTFGFDDSRLSSSVDKLNDIVQRVLNIGEAAYQSNTAVKDLLTSLGANSIMRIAKSDTSTLTKETTKMERGRKKAEEDSANAALRNASAQERIKTALHSIAAARASLTSAMAKGNQEDVAHARLLIQLLDNYSTKLNAVKGTFLGDRGALTGLLGSGYTGLMRNVRETIGNIGKISSQIEQSPVSLFANQDTSNILKQINAIGAGYSRLQQVMSEINNTVNPRQGWRAMKMEDINKYGGYEKAVTVLRDNLNRAKKELDDMAKSGMNVTEPKRQLDALFETLMKFEALKPMDISQKLGLEHLRGYTGPRGALGDEAWASAKREAEIREVAIQAANRHEKKLAELTEAFNRAAQAEERANQATARTAARQQADYQRRQQSTQATRHQAEELVRLRQEMLRTQAAELQSLLRNGKGSFSAAQYKEVLDTLRAVREEMRQIDAMVQRGGLGTRGLFDIGRGGMSHAPFIQNAQQVLAARNAVHQLTIEEQNLASAIEKARSSMQGQNQTLSELKTMAAQYISLWGARSFLNNIIEVGGQLEQQRLSIGAILGNTAHANDLFNRIKSLAVQSPFGVVELDQYTKQLSAYGFKYNELYDMTKRLADISAGAGTDVGRLALALGHVRSEGALSGYTLRQFAMNNIPMVGELSKRLSEVEGRMVSIAEVRKRVSKKEIGYDEVEAVIKKLTDEGGMFYNMQEVISESVKARFKNLKDSLDIMYGEMAESKVGDGLKGLATTLLELTRHWQELFAVLSSGMLVLGVMRAQQMVMRRVMGEEVIAVQQGIAARQRMVAENAKLASSYRTVGAAEKASLLTRRQMIISGYQQALSEKKLTLEQLSRAVATGKLSKSQALLAIRTSTLSAEEKALGVEMVMNTRKVGAFRLAVDSLARSLKALVFNPMTAILAGISVVTELWARNNVEVERTKELYDDILNRATEGIKNIQTMFGETGVTFNIGNGTKPFSEVTKDDLLNGGKFNFPKPDSLTSDALRSLIEQYTTFIKEYSAMPNTIINNSLKDDEGNVRSLKDQYNELTKAISNVAEAYIWMKDMALAAEYAEKITNGGWFDDDFSTNIDDYSNRVKEYNDAVSDLLRTHLKEVNVGLAAARSNEKFAASLKKAKIGANDLKEQLKYLVENRKEFHDAVMLFKEQNSWGFGEDVFNPTGRVFAYSSGVAGRAAARDAAYDTLEQDLDTYIEGLKQKINELGWDISKLTGGQKEAIAQAIAETVGKAGMATEDVKKKIIDLAKTKIGIQIDANTAEAAAKANALKLSLEQLVGHTWHIDIKAESNAADVIKTIRTSYADAQAFFANAKPFMMKMGVDISGGMKALGQMQITSITNRWIEMQKKRGVANPDPAIVENMIHYWNDMANAWQDAMDFSKATGISLTDPTKKSGSRKSTDSTKDKELEAVRNRLSLYKKFYSELDKARKEYGSGALDYVRENGFEEVFGWGLDDMEDYEKSVEQIISKITSGKLSEERKKFINDARADETAEKRKQDTDALREYSGELKRMMDIISQNYNVYKEWLKLTGNASLAASIAGVAEGTSYSDYLREQMRNELDRRGSSLDADYVFGIEDVSELKKEFGENSTIKTLWEAWRKNTEDLRKENEKMLQEAVKGAKDYGAQIADVNNELQRQLQVFATLDDKNLAAALSKNAQDNAAKKISNIRWEQFKNENDWGRVFGDLDRMPLDTIRKMIKAMNEFDVTALKDIKDTKEWYNALRRLTDKEAVLDPIGGITSAAKQYLEAMDELNMSKAERKSRGLPELTDKRREQLEDTIASLLVTIQKSLKALASSMNNLSSTLQSLGSSIGGKTGNFFNALGTIFGAYGKSMDALSSVDLNAKGVTAVMQKVGAVAAIVGTMIDMNKKLSELLPSQEKAYEHYARKAREVNKLREAVDDYARSVARAQAEEETWFGGNDLTKLRAEGERMRTELKAYYNELYEPQVAYKNKGAGWSKWAVPIATGIAAVAGVVATALTGGAAGVAILGAMATLEGMVGTVAATAIGTAVAAGIGAAAGQAINAGIEQFTYGNGQVAARQNLLMQTRHRSFWRSEKTENLEDWVRKNLNAELFDSETGLVDLKAAEQVLEKYGDKLVGDTRATLERLVEIRKEYDEFIKNIEDYVGEIGDNLASNMTDAIWDWLADGKNALDSFKEYAGDTFKQVAQDIMSTFLSVTVLDDFKDKFKNLWEQYSPGLIDERELAQQTAILSGQMARAYNATLPMAQNLATIMKDAFGAEGIDIVGDRNTSSDRNVIRGDFTEEETGLLLSYVNAIRGDCSANRMALLQILTVVQGNGELSVIAQSQLRQLEMIAVNTGATASNTARISEIYDILHENVLGGNQFNIA